MGKRHSGETENAEEVEESSAKKKKLSVKASSKVAVTNINKKPDKKRDWVKYKERKKELKVERKKQRCLYSTSLKAKQIWEKYRQKSCTATARAELGNKLHELLKGHYSQAVLSHDLGRIIQWLIKLGNVDMQLEISKELQDNYVDVCQSKYGSYTMRKLLKKGTRKIKDEIISSVMGHVVKFMCHKIAAPIVSVAYELYANANQKCLMKQEFYGDLYKLTKDNSVKNLKMALDPCQNMRKAVLGSTKANLLKIMNKNMANSSLVNDVIAEFISCCEDEDRTEIISAIKSFLPEMTKSKEGGRVGRFCLWYGTQKDRKAIIKAFKGFVAEIAVREHGSLVLLAMLDCVDDTVLVQKAIISEVIANVLEIAKDKNGRKVVLYLVAPRDPLYFHPAIVQVLQEGDGNPYSKKLPEIRRKELLDSVMNPFLTSVAEKIDEWIADSSIAMVTLAILKAGTGEKLKMAFEAVAKYVCNTGLADEEAETKPKSVAENPGLHFFLKKLIHFDKERKNKDEVSFSEVFVNTLDASAIHQLILSNRGCFLLIMLLETEIEACVKLLTSQMSEDICQALKTKTFKGSEILLKKLNK